MPGCVWRGEGVLAEALRLCCLVPGIYIIRAGMG
jgi:hypothetical protein